LKQENQELRDELTRLRQAMRSLVRLQSKIEMITPQTNLVSVTQQLPTSTLASLLNRR
jgi:hypothetical protein